MGLARISKYHDFIGERSKADANYTMADHGRQNLDKNDSDNMSGVKKCHAERNGIPFQIMGGI